MLYTIIPCYRNHHIIRPKIAFVGNNSNWLLPLLLLFSGLTQRRKKLITIFEQNKSKNLIHLGNKSLFRKVYETTLVDWDFSMTIQQMKFHFFFTMMSFLTVNHPSEMWYVLFSNYFKELKIFWDLINLSF